MRLLQSGFKWTAAALAAAAISLGGTAQAATTAPLYAYVGGGCNGLAALPKFEAAIGRKVDGVADFMDHSSTWDNLLSGLYWGVSCWEGKVPNLSFAMPMVMPKEPLADASSGVDNDYYKQVAQKLVLHGFPNAYIRIGWEFNGNWYPWQAAPSPALWVAGYKNIVNVMRSVPGANFKFVWNPSLWANSIYPDQVYPGDSYVDLIGTDVDNAGWEANYTNPAVMWNGMMNDPWAVAAVAAFAKTHNKPIAFPEWATGTRTDGHGGGDSPMFVANLAQFMATANIAYHSYWDVAADYSSEFDNGSNLKALAAYINAFGTSTAGTTSTVPAVRNLGRILKQYASSYTPAPITVTCTNCSAQVLQNAPNHYEVIVWNDAGAASATLAWGKKASSANLYDPNVGASAVRGIGATTSVTTALIAGRPVIVAVQL